MDKMRGSSRGTGINQKLCQDSARNAEQTQRPQKVVTANPGVASVCGSWGIRLLEGEESWLPRVRANAAWPTRQHCQLCIYKDRCSFNSFMIFQPPPVPLELAQARSGDGNVGTHEYIAERGMGREVVGHEFLQRISQRPKNVGRLS